MATLTKLENKLAEVLGLAMAAQDAAQQVRGMLGSEHEPAAAAATADLAFADRGVRERTETPAPFGGVPPRGELLETAWRREARISRAL